MKTIFGVALALTLSACGSLGPQQYGATKWATVPFDQAKAQCRAQMDRDFERSEGQQTFNQLMDTGRIFRSCLGGYGYVVVK